MIVEKKNAKDRTSNLVVNPIQGRGGKIREGEVKKTRLGGPGNTKKYIRAA